MLLIGSQALKHHIPSFDRVSKDTDFVCSKLEFEEISKYFKKNKNLMGLYPVSGTCIVAKTVNDFTKNQDIYEYNIAYEGTSNKMIFDYCNNESHASLNVLLALKLSHRYKKNSPHFLKTMEDVHFLRSVGANVKDEKLAAILKVREKETYDYSHPSLMQDKDNFFVKDESFYVWDHDDIHKAVATLDKPAYMYFKPNDSEVMVSKKMWDECEHHIKLRAGLEEAMVLATERSLVPHPGKLTPKQAFDKALEKVCTSITSGWFREFCWENYYAIQNLYNEDFVDKFNCAVEKGEVKRFNQGT